MPKTKSKTGRTNAARFNNASVSTLLLNVVADTESLDELTILDDVVLLDIAKKAAALTDEHKQTTTGVEVLLMRLHVLGEALDALGKDGNLNLGITGVDR